jgi:hypothetical protein
VNVFYRHCEEDFLVSESGIFAISADSRLFAYSHENNNITIYLMENGLKLFQKILIFLFFNYEILFLEFIEDKKLFIIGKR